MLEHYPIFFPNVTSWCLAYEVDPGFWTSGLGGADAVPF
jgi:hypothetical protein